MPVVWAKIVEARRARGSQEMAKTGLNWGHCSAVGTIVEEKGCNFFFLPPVAVFAIEE